MTTVYRTSSQSTATTPIAPMLGLWQAMIDDRWMAQSSGVTLQLNPPTKQERVLTPSKPWESTAICAYNTVLEHDGTYLMYYDSASDFKKPDGRSICLATSQDGVNWDRPDLGLFNWRGHQSNNIVLPGCHGSVYLDPNGPDEHRFKALVIVKENDVWLETRGAIFGKYPGYPDLSFQETYLCTSPDGLRWTRHKTPALVYFHDTQNQFLYDPKLKRYVAYFRSHNVDPLRCRSVGRVEFADPMQLPWPFPERPDQPRGPGLSRHEAGDEFPPVLACDDQDPTDTDLYTPSIIRLDDAEDCYLSFTTPYRHYPVGDTSNTDLQGRDSRGRYVNDGPLETQLATSRDGIQWSRPDRTPYIPLGLNGDWDGGQTYPALGLLHHNNQLFQYYTGTAHTHGAFQLNTHEGFGGIGRLTQRPQGFMSATFDRSGGWLKTPYFQVTGSNLQVNVDCGAMGELTIEVQDEQGSPIPGFEASHCDPIDRNHLALNVRWRGKPIAKLEGKTVRLQIRGGPAKLYAIRINNR